MSKTAFVFISLLALQALAKPAPAAKIKCEPQKLKSAAVEVYQNPATKSKWLSVSQESKEFFSSLGFKPVKGASAQMTGAENLKYCPAQREFHKIMSVAKQNIGLVATNPCEEKVSRSLGLTPAVIENYGSMEGPKTIPWSAVRICTDGKKLFPCMEATAEMQKCLAKL